LMQIELQGVEKRFGGELALGPLDLTLAAGTQTALIGSSGCGKSTLLRLLVGLLRPDRGRLLLAGRAPGPDDWRALRHRMGYVIQEGGLFPHLTAAENAGLAARHLGWEVSRRERRLAELAELVRLPRELFNRYPSELSGGQRQRVALVRALFLDPELLLLDEPLGALDPLVRSELQEDLRAIFRRLGKTVVLVTHDLAEAARLCPELVLLEAGRLVQRGSVEDLFHRPAEPFVTRFVSAQQRLVLGGGAP
jgi:osmoprotectant transport system ATP-binding protein